VEFVSRFIHTLLPSPIDMHPEPDAPFIRTGKLLRIIDGDTYEVEIDLGWDIRITTDVRLFLVNTPEKRGVERVAGQYVAKCVRQWIADISGVVEGAPVTISSERYRAGKYGRIWSRQQCHQHWTPVGVSTLD
jgi:endonuclease YncB( thermonuclease family)